MGLAHDLALLDRNQPGWDYELRIQGALRRLREDASVANRRDVELLFGKVMADDAYQRVSEEVARTAGASANAVTTQLPLAAIRELSSKGWDWLAPDVLVRLLFSQPSPLRLHVPRFRPPRYAALTGQPGDAYHYRLGRGSGADFQVRFIERTGRVQTLERVDGQTVLTLYDVQLRHTIDGIEVPGTTDHLDTYQVALNNTELLSIRRVDPPVHRVPRKRQYKRRSKEARQPGTRSETLKEF